MIYEMLREGRSDEELLGRLLWIESERMGLDSPGSNITQSRKLFVSARYRRAIA
jgi:hypothetical protein